MRYLMKNPDFSEDEAAEPDPPGRALTTTARRPARRILEWQQPPGLPDLLQPGRPGRLQRLQGSRVSGRGLRANRGVPLCKRCGRGSDPQPGLGDARQGCALTLSFSWSTSLEILAIARSNVMRGSWPVAPARRPGKRWPRRCRLIFTTWSGSGLFFTSRHELDIGPGNQVKVSGKALDFLVDIGTELARKVVGAVADLDLHIASIFGGAIAKDQGRPACGPRDRRAVKSRRSALSTPSGRSRATGRESPAPSQVRIDLIDVFVGLRAFLRAATSRSASRR